MERKAWRGQALLWDQACHRGSGVESKGLAGQEWCEEGGSINQLKREKVSLR